MLEEIWSGYANVIDGEIVLVENDGRGIVPFAKMKDGGIA